MFKIDTNIFDSIDIEIENLTLNKIHNLKKNSQLTRKFSTQKNFQDFPKVRRKFSTQQKRLD